MRVLEWRAASRLVVSLPAYFLLLRFPKTLVAFKVLLKPGYYLLTWYTYWFLSSLGFLSL